MLSVKITILLSYGIFVSVFCEPLDFKKGNETGRLFGDYLFTIFDFLDNLMIRNQEKLTRQATTTTLSPMEMMMMGPSEKHYHIQKVEIPDTPKNGLIYLWNKFVEKVDHVLLTKILLKLIVFKKIVKFFSLICLLFFLPTLKENPTTGRVFRDDYDYDVNKTSNFREKKEQ